MPTVIRGRAAIVHMADELNRSIEQLWRDYEFLTKEISRFIDTRDDGLVSDLVSQRNKLEVIIKEKNDQVFHKTPEGKAFIGSLLAINKDATARLQQRYNNLKHQQRLSHAYDSGTNLTFPTRYLDEDM